MNSQEFCHQWVARVLDGKFQHRTHGHIFCDDHTIYSYGTHFPMARLVEKRNGAKLFIVNSGSYSVTTEKHMGFIRQAIPVHYQILGNSSYRDIMTPWTRKDYQEKVGVILNAARKRRDYRYIQRDLNSFKWYQTLAERTDKFYGGKRAGVFTDTIEQELLNRFEVIKKKQAEHSKKERAAIDAILLAYDLTIEKLVKLDDEQMFYNPSGDHSKTEETFKTLMESEYWRKILDAMAEYEKERGNLFKIEGSEVVTDNSARVPLASAVALIRYIEANGDLESCHIKVGEYTCTKATMDEIVIGCHRFEKEQIEKFRSLLPVENQGETKR